MAIYQDHHQPYFYIIQDVRNGMYYTGAKWAKDANPSNFMMEGGYETSSETIKELIRQHGLNNFIIRKIRTFETGAEAYRYETRFLQKVDARNNPRFYNGHNNDGTMNPDKMKLIMMELYGVDNYSKYSGFIDKTKKTCLEKYGKEWYVQTDEYKEKVKQSSQEKYGVNHFTQSDEYKENMKNVMNEKYGVDNYVKTGDFKIQYKETMNEKYGVDNYAKTGDFKIQYKETMNEKYGVDNGFQAEEVKEKIRKTFLSKYGTEYFVQSEQGRLALSKPKSNTENYFKPKSDSHKENIRKAALNRERIPCSNCGKTFTKANIKKHEKSCKNNK